MPEGDSLLWAIVIASHACEAIAIMQPGRMSVRNLEVIDRTNLSTLATANTFIGVDLKELVVDKMTVEKCAEDTAVETRCGPPLNVHANGAAVENNIAELLQNAISLHLLLSLAEVRIDIHKRQTDIDVRHNDRTASLDLKPFLCQERFKLVGIFSTVITTCNEEISIERARGLDCKFPYKLTHHRLYPPTMDRQTEPYPLAIVKMEHAIALDGIWNRHHPIVGYSRKLLSSPTGIACAREIEYHVNE